MNINPLNKGVTEYSFSFSFFLTKCVEKRIAHC